MLHDPKREAHIEEEIFHSKLEPWQITMLAAAEEIRQRGWCRHSLLRPNGEVCTWGGFYIATGLLDMKTRRIRSDFVSREHPTLVLATDKLEDFIGTDIIHWNDVPFATHARGQAHVIYTLQLCALGG